MPARHIVILIDRSGSMLSKKEDTEGGLAAFMDAQKTADGDTIVSLYEFDDRHNTVYLETPLDQVPAYTLKPRGMTALYDAIGATIEDVRKARKPIPKADRPNIIMVIGTDGLENASQEYTADQIKKMITRRQNKGWTFIFLGADQDAFAQSGRIGIPQMNTMSYDGEKSAQAYTVTGLAVARGAQTGDYSFTDDERTTLA